MFDVAPTELLLCAIVALLVIGPKDLPRAMRTVGQFVARVRGVARQFRSGFDEMVRQAELDEMEKAWARENARIMREHPPEEADDAEWARGDHEMLPIEHQPAPAGDGAPDEDHDDSGKADHAATPAAPPASAERP